jgi:predicted GNAT family N-acyltransferase
MSFEIIEHSKLSNKTLDEIIRIKSIYWKYDYNQQKSWIFENINNKDLHLIMLNENGNINGYLNLVNINININYQIYKALGIGNICVNPNKSGYGSVLLAHLNESLKQYNKIGILFCDDNLISFYKKNNWELIMKEYMTTNISSNMMLFNYKGIIKQINFNSRKF